MDIRGFFSKALLVLIITFSSASLFAQPNGGGVGGGQGQGGNPPSGTGAPIDGAAIMLLAGAAGYAHLKLKAQKKK